MLAGALMKLLIVGLGWDTCQLVMTLGSGSCSKAGLSWPLHFASAVLCTSEQAQALLRLGVSTVVVGDVKFAGPASLCTQLESSCNRLRRNHELIVDTWLIVAALSLQKSVDIENYPVAEVPRKNLPEERFMDVDEEICDDNWVGECVAI